jgi:hypothetical protein
VADGYEVDPEALRAASRGVHTSADAVGLAATRLSVAQLVPGALGEIDAAYELAAAFAEFVGAQADDLRRGAEWVTNTAEGLVSSADEYARREVFPL